jgi:hypothetical protein
MELSKQKSNVVELSVMDFNLDRFQIEKKDELLYAIRNIFTISVMCGYGLRLLQKNKQVESPIISIILNNNLPRYHSIKFIVLNDHIISMTAYIYKRELSDKNIEDYLAIFKNNTLASEDEEILMLEVREINKMLMLCDFICKIL